MVLSEICIKRPVFASVLSMIIVLIGLISYSRLTVREYPKIDEPIVSVDTTYKGASPDVIESQVTKPLEDQLAGIEGVTVMTSHSRSERSQINIKFGLSRDPDAAAAEVRVFGERLPSMRIYVDRDKLAAYGQTVQDFEAALRSQNVEIPAGRIESHAREFSVVSYTDLRTSAQFENVVFTRVNGYPVRLRDVANVEIAAANDRILSRFNGQPAINIGITRQSTANPLELSQATREEVERLNQTLPTGYALEYCLWLLHFYRGIDRLGVSHHRRSHCAGRAP